VRKLYDAEVMSTDHAMSVLFSELERRGFLENALIVFTADHGEELWDHGWRGHSHSLYDELIRVPLLIRLPGQKARVDVPEGVSLVDIAPTLIDWISGDVVDSFEGRSLKRLMSGGDHRPVVVSELIRHQAFRRHTRHERAVIMASRKLIVDVDGQKVFFDQESDPGEKQASGLSDSERQELERALDAFVAEMGEHRPGEIKPMDEEALKELRSLGYVE
jgi:uncharacterized sulfatase